jgi:hypothetical protein
MSFDQTRSGVAFAIPQLIHDRPPGKPTLDGEGSPFYLADLEDLRQREPGSREGQLLNEGLPPANIVRSSTCVENPKHPGIVKGVHPRFATVTEQRVRSDSKPLQDRDETRVIGEVHAASLNVRRAAQRFPSSAIYPAFSGTAPGGSMDPTVIVGRAEAGAEGSRHGGIPGKLEVADQYERQPCLGDLCTPPCSGWAERYCNSRRIERYLQALLKRQTSPERSIEVVGHLVRECAHVASSARSRTG